MFVATELNEIIESSESINVYNDGQVFVYTNKEAPYKQIVEGWLALTENSHEMPAFGVSLNNYTTEAIRVGLWVEFVFDRQYTHSDMPFEKLLVKVESQSQGFNIIRYSSQGGYDGRCYYFDLLGKDMSSFYDILVNL